MFRKIKTKKRSSKRQYKKKTRKNFKNNIKLKHSRYGALHAQRNSRKRGGGESRQAMLPSLSSLPLSAVTQFGGVWDDLKRDVLKRVDDARNVLTPDETREGRLNRLEKDFAIFVRILDEEELRMCRLKLEYYQTAQRKFPQGVKKYKTVQDYVDAIKQDPDIKDIIFRTNLRRHSIEFGRRKIVETVTEIERLLDGEDHPLIGYDPVLRSKSCQEVDPKARRAYEQYERAQEEQRDKAELQAQSAELRARIRSKQLRARREADGRLARFWKLFVSREKQLEAEEREIIRQDFLLTRARIRDEKARQKYSDDWERVWSQQIEEVDEQYETDDSEESDGEGSVMSGEEIPALQSEDTGAFQNLRGKGD